MTMWKVGVNETTFYVERIEQSVLEIYCDFSFLFFFV